MGFTELLFFENVGLPGRVSRRLLGPAEPEGRPAKLTPFFSALRARRGGHGARARARLTIGGPRSIPRLERRAAPRSAERGQRKNGPPVENNTFQLVVQGSHSGSGMFPAE